MAVLILSHIMPSLPVMQRDTAGVVQRCDAMRAVRLNLNENSYTAAMDDFEGGNCGGRPTV